MGSSYCCPDNKEIDDNRTINVDSNIEEELQEIEIFTRPIQRQEEYLKQVSLQDNQSMHNEFNQAGMKDPEGILINSPFTSNYQVNLRTIKTVSSKKNRKMPEFLIKTGNDKHNYKIEKFNTFTGEHNCLDFFSELFVTIETPNKSPLLQVKTTITSQKNINTMMNNIDYFKVAVLGKENVGKSCLIKRLVNDCFYSIYKPTAKPNVYRMTFEIRMIENTGSLKNCNNTKKCFTSSFKINDFELEKVPINRNNTNCNKPYIDNNWGNSQDRRRCSRAVNIEFHDIPFSYQGDFADYSNDCQLIIMVFDMNDNDSYKFCTNLFSRIKWQGKECIMVGNKKDTFVNEKERLYKLDIREFNSPMTTEWISFCLSNHIHYLDLSVKLNYNMKRLIKQIIVCASDFCLNMT